VNLIQINDFRGTYTNVDPLDIPDGAMLELKNMYPKNGRLVKTFGIGELLGTATASTAVNLYTFIESHLTMSGLTGEVIIAIYINSYTVTLYAWVPGGGGGADWYAPGTIFTNWTGTFYHKNEKNPIVVQNNILRLLPGNVGEDGSSHECKGIWLGYIDLDYFDGNYEAGTDYTAAFFNYATEIAAPTIGDFTHATVDGGKFNPDGNEPVNTFYYRYTYVYDGIQESLFSDPVGIKYGDDQHLKVTHAITMASHNKRITAIKVYRSSEEYEISITAGKTTTQIQRGRASDPVTRRGDVGSEGEVITDFAASIVSSLTTNFHHITTIDLLREANNFETDTGLYWCRNKIWIPGLTTVLDELSVYTLSLDGGVTYFDVDNTEVIDNLIQRTPPATFTSEYWNAPWSLKDDGVVVESGTSGAYAGPNVVTIPTDLGIDVYVGGVLYYDNDTTKPMVIEKNYHYVLSVTSAGTGTENTGTWYAMKPSTGLYFTDESAGVVTYTIFDNRITSGESHPLEGEVSVKVNGRYASIIGERLWQANVVLDPGGTNEAHDDWATYSEIAQYDVNPVSNVITIGDNVGGAITGLHDMFGNPVFCKQHTIVTLQTRNSANPANWSIGGSPHHIGNLATRGSIVVLDSLYVCYIDGIYELSPNNLAETDATPTNKLKISDPIGDIYQDISDKTAIIVGYEPRRNEIVFKLDASNVWAFSIETREWRQIDSAVAFTVFANDENGDLMVYGTDKKVYAFDVSESVTSSMRTKVYEVSFDDNMRIVQDITITYKSAAALTMKVYWDDNIESGNIEYDVTYTVVEEPYVNGSTYTVTYNGVAKTNGETFTGLVGLKTYTVSAGTGIVVNTSSFTLPANTARQQYTLRMGRWAKRMKIEITSASGTSNVEIDKMVIATE